MKRTQQKIRDQTIDKIMAKPAGVVKNYDETIIWTSAMASLHLWTLPNQYLHTTAA